LIIIGMLAKSSTAPRLRKVSFTRVVALLNTTTKTKLSGCHKSRKILFHYWTGYKMIFGLFFKLRF
jgi:hypothetical protein